MLVSAAVRRPGVPEGHDALGVTVRQRTEEHSIHHAPERGVGADAESQGEKTRERMDGLAAQAADSVAEVASEAADGGPDLLLPCRRGLGQAGPQRRGPGGRGHEKCVESTADQDSRYAETPAPALPGARNRSPKTRAISSE